MVSPLMCGVVSDDSFLVMSDESSLVVSDEC